MASRWFLLALMVLASSAAATEDVCSMCSCTKNGASTLIDCASRELNVVPNANTSSWPSDANLDAKFDNNTIVHLTTLGSIPTLQRLSLVHCHLTMIDDLVFMNLPNLTYLDLSNNQLTSEVLRPQIFRGLYAADSYEPMRNMRVLNMDYNSIHSLDHNLFEHLTFLTELSLRGNPLNVLDHSTVIAISSLDHLVMLDLSYTDLASLPQYSLNSPRHLDELRLDGNRFQEVPTDALADTHVLKTLTLDDNPIKNMFIHTFPPLMSLEHLSLSFLPNLTVVGPHTFDGMPKLETLILTHNERLQYIDPDAFRNQNNDSAHWSLRKLYLNENKLGRLPKQLLQRWDALEDLSLQGNPWICDCENQWILTDLIFILDDMKSPAIICEEPIEMRGQTFKSLAESESHLRCLDIYGHQPEKDGAILIGVLIGVLLAVPLTVALVFVWRRFGPSLTGRHPPGPADYTRAFYKRADVTFNHEAA